MNTKQQEPITMIRAFPFIWFAIFLGLRVLQTSSTAIYFNAVYYWGFFAFFLCTKQFQSRELLAHWKSGKSFWIGILLAFAGMLLAFLIGMLPSLLFHVEDGLKAYRIDSPVALLLFAITLIPLPSIVEECFFRKHHTL